MLTSIDRGLHWATLIVTALLPRRLRVRLRKRWLESLQRRMLHNADVIFIRHPKTGGTWLRVLLTHLFAAKYGTSRKRVFKADELYLQNRALPRFLITNGLMSWERLVGDAFERDDPVLKGKKILFMARHPGDVVVSWHRQYQKRTKAFKRELLEAEMPETVDWPNLSRWEFIQRPELGLPSLIEYHNFWARQLDGREGAMITRYEDLREDTADSLEAITRFLGEEFTREQIEAAVAFASVDNLRRLEHSGYFQNSSLRLRDAADPDTYKVRRAKVGGFRDDLDEEQADWVEQQVREKSHPVLGYRVRGSRGGEKSEARA